MATGITGDSYKGKREIDEWVGPPRCFLCLEFLRFFLLDAFRRRFILSNEAALRWDNRPVADFAWPECAAKVLDKRRRVRPGAA
jgi:hypothetical protein